MIGVAREPSTPQVVLQSMTEDLATVLAADSAVAGSAGDEASGLVPMGLEGAETDAGTDLPGVSQFAQL